MTPGGGGVLTAPMMTVMLVLRREAVGVDQPHALPLLFLVEEIIT